MHAACVTLPAEMHRAAAKWCWCNWPTGTQRLPAQPNLSSRHEAPAYCTRFLQEALAVICSEGLDIRVSNHKGALGAGAYFASSASYSLGFSQGQRPAGLADPPAAAAPLGADSARPRFEPGAHAMLLCRMALGRPAPGQARLRKPPHGYQSTSISGRHYYGTVYAVYANSAAYPQ